jgi:hypothetical protein
LISKDTRAFLSFDVFQETDMPSEAMAFLDVPFLWILSIHQSLNILHELPFPWLHFMKAKKSLQRAPHTNSEPRFVEEMTGRFLHLVV